MSVFEVRGGNDRRSMIKRYERKSKQEAIRELVDLIHCNWNQIEQLEAQLTSQHAQQAQPAVWAVFDGPWIDDHTADKNRAEQWTEDGREVVALYTAPQPSAGVVMPERKTAADFDYYIDSFASEAAEIHNRVIDEFARLNGKEVGRG